MLVRHTFLHKGYPNPNWFLLDTVFSIDVFSNPKIMTNIHKSERTTKIHCDAGVV